MGLDTSYDNIKLAKIRVGRVTVNTHIFFGLVVIPLMPILYCHLASDLDYYCCIRHC